MSSIQPDIIHPISHFLGRRESNIWRIFLGKRKDPKQVPPIIKKTKMLSWFGYIHQMTIDRASFGPELRDEEQILGSRGAQRMKGKASSFSWWWSLKEARKERRGWRKRREVSGYCSISTEESKPREKSRKDRRMGMWCRWSGKDEDTSRHIPRH